jgi:hypothetical protein
MFRLLPGAIIRESFWPLDGLLFHIASKCTVQEIKYSVSYFRLVIRKETF